MSHLPATRAIHVHRRLRSGRRKNGAAHRAIHACTDGSSRLCAHVRMSRCDKIRAAAGLHSALTIRASTTPAPPPDKTPAPQPYPHGTAVRLEFPSEGGGRSVGEHPRDRRGSGKWMPRRMRNKPSGGWSRRQVAGTQRPPGIARRAEEAGEGVGPERAPFRRCGAAAGA